ncbi:hypothetical protein P3X46_023724 [Hevea brasiliensis]|uniref:BHLH domain-containing protein n=2 Tax=Hevea brasiliensis TaxID=3981 RepID=A0ABQ9LFB9_HEVBR|nr:hypothetical protein P3X46_023724 [Hevea brasiliensis]
MFPSHQNNQLSFQISSTPYQENTIPQDLLLIPGHSTVDGIDPSKKNNMGKGRQRNPCLSHKKDENNTVAISTKGKRIIHRDIERRRRQEMATLYTSLRNLLPLEYIKGKRAISDHVQEAVKYTKDLQKKIEELSVRRDEMKNLSNLRVLDSEDERLNSFAPTSVMVRSCFAGVEVVINSGFGKQVLHLSRALELLLEEGLDVFSCISTRVNQRVIHTIQSKVSYMTCIDTSELQNKLIEAIPSTCAENS